jgi:hypothetical protein
MVTPEAPESAGQVSPSRAAQVDKPFIGAARVAA